MDWLKGMNEAVGYIEDNLSGDIDYTVAAKYVCCSVSEFQRVFSFMTKIPLSEYIRRRKLTLAAYDIQRNKEKVIDVAIKYGYDSPAAFSRAFSNVHGVTPTSARNEGVKLKTYPRISFKLIIQGCEEMDYKIVKKNETKIIGMNEKMSTIDNAHWSAISKFWDRFKEKENHNKLKSYAVNDNVYAITTYTEETDAFFYMLGMEYCERENVDGYEILTVPAGTYAVFEVPPECEADVGSFTIRIFKEWLPATGYKLTGGAEIECMTKNGTIIWLPIAE